jgi:hypothetical protein
MIIKFAHHEEEIRDLVQEVSKARPNLSKVKSLVKKFDIEFSQDPIEQMSLVLERFNSLNLQFAPKATSPKATSPKDSEL